MYELSKDEVFILGNIGIGGLLLGRFDLSAPIVEMLQRERPRNAAGFIAEAMYLNSIGDHEAAVALLETSGALQADVSLDEALGIYVFSLFHSGEQERAYNLAKTFLDDSTVESVDALLTFFEIVELYEEQGS